VAPYAILPPVHGGAVFMSQTVKALAPLADLHLIVLVDAPHEIAAHQPLEEICGSVEYVVRLEGRPKQIGSIEPYAVREFSSPELDWLIHRQLWTKRIDVLQLEYTQLGTYALPYRRIVRALFEHDIYFQTLGRLLRQPTGWLNQWPVALEYLRTLRYELELLETMDHVQVCSEANREYVLRFAPHLAPKLEAGLRAGITVSDYEYRETGRIPDTVLFLGSFRHGPNQEALFWFVRDVLHHIVKQRPQVRFVIVGSDPPDRHGLPYPEGPGDPIEIVGFVRDIREALGQYAVFVCPILTGSGVRVKLLEAFAAGIPVVSTRIGAEGLAASDGEYCRLADDPREFAARTLELLENPAEGMTQRARREVERNWDIPALTQRLARRYEELIKEKQ
jgi:glycosyltransferase involved in cell wall biosynthesis